MKNKVKSLKSSWGLVLFAIVIIILFSVGVWSYLGFWNLIVISLISFFFISVPQKMFRVKKKMIGKKEVYNPSEIPHTISLLFHSAVLIYFFVILLNDGEVSFFYFWWDEWSLALILKVQPLLLYLLFFFLMGVYIPFKQILWSSNDNISFDEDFIYYLNSDSSKSASTKGKIKLSEIKKVSSDKTSISLVLKSGEKHEIPTAEMNFSGEDVKTIVNRLSK